MPPGISNALRAHAAARDRTYVGKNSVANADVMQPEPRPKKIARHSTGSITATECVWNRMTPKIAEHAVYRRNVGRRPHRSISRPAATNPTAPTMPAAARYRPESE